MAVHKYNGYFYKMGKQVYITLDVLRCELFELNPTQSILASYLHSRIAASAPHTITQVGNDLYYRADYDFTAANCPILPAKADTLRRLYKELEEKEIIKLLKIGRNVCFAPTEVLREWGTELKYIAPLCSNAENNPLKTENNPLKTENNPPIKDNNQEYQENNDDRQTLFAPDPIPDQVNEKKTLFRNSEVFKMVNGDDYSVFESQFTNPEFDTIDLVYYFHAVSDWSDQKNMKRTKNGWLATVRNFIRGDAEKGKLHFKPVAGQTRDFDVDGAMAYLKNDL